MAFVSNYLLFFVIFIKLLGSECLSTSDLRLARNIQHFTSARSSYPSTLQRGKRVPNERITSTQNDADRFQPSLFIPEGAVILHLRGGGQVHHSRQKEDGNSMLLALFSFAAGVAVAKGFSISTIPNMLSAVKSKLSPRLFLRERKSLNEKDPEPRDHLLQALAALAAATMAAGLVGFSLQGSIRALGFWRNALPLYIRYRLAEKLINMERDPRIRQRRWDALHDRHAPRALAAIMRLKGFYVKVASSRNDFMPAQFIRALSRLQDDLPAFPPSQVRRIVEADMGRPLETVFSDFDFKCLGAASIGQCHRATLLSTGEEVAVKVQSPKAEKLFKCDLVCARLFCKLAMPEWVPILDEIERQFLTEFDYEREARNLELVQRNMRQQYPKYIVHVPTPVMELCTKNVLVMEFIPGVKLANSIKNDLAYAVGEQAAQDFIDTFRFQLKGLDPGGEADLTTTLHGPL